MNTTLKLIEILYNKHELLIDEVKTKITSIDINNLHPTYSCIINKSKTVPLYQIKGISQLNNIFNLVMYHDCFKSLFENKEFLEISLEDNTFFEDKWFIKSFTNLLDYFDRYTNSKDNYIRYLDDTIIPYTIWTTINVKVKISKSFIKKSTVNILSDKFNIAFDEFAENVYNEYLYHNQLPF